MTQDFDWSSVGTPVESGSDDWSSVASPVSETPKQNKGIAGDTITDLKRGVQGIPGIATGLADMQTAWLTGDTYANKAADYLGEITGFQPSKWANEAKKEYSPARQASSLAVSKAWDDNDSPFNDAMNGDFSGIGNIAKSYVQNPLHTIGSVVESLPSMALGGLAGRGVGIATKISPALSGALGEGMVMTGQQMNQLTEDGADPRLSAAASLATGLFGAGIGALGGKLSHHLGVVDPNTAMAGGAIRGVAEEVGDRSIDGVVKTGAKHIAEGAKRVAGGAVSEGLFEELPQSVLEQTLSNLAQGKPWDEGVSRAAIEGTLAGSLMGGAFNVLPPSVQAPGQQPPDNQNQNPLLALPAPTYTGTPGDQIIAADSNRQAAIDKAQADADALYAARDAYELEQRRGFHGGVPTITNDPAPIQQRIDALLGINQARLTGIASSNYEKALEAAFNEQIGFVSGKNSEEIPFTMGDYLKSKVAAADITRDKPKADAANQNALNRLGQLDSEETQQIPEIPVVGPLSFAANNAVRTGASELIRGKQSVANSGQVAVETNQISSASGAVAPNIASAAPSITDQAPSIEGGSNASKPKQVATQAPQTNDAQAASFDVSNRTDKQLEYLTQHGQPGWKEAAVAELQKRGVQISNPQQAKSDTLSIEKPANADKKADGEVKNQEHLSGKIAQQQTAKFGSAEYHAQIEEGFRLDREAMKGFKVGDTVSWVSKGTYTQKDGTKLVDPVRTGKITGVRDKDHGVFEIDGNIYHGARFLTKNNGSTESDGNANSNGDGVIGKDQNQQTEKPKAKHPLSVGFMPGAADPITVKDGVVYIGKYPAQNFDTGEDVTVPAGATDKQVVTALKDAGAIAGKMRVFGMEKEEAKDAIGWTAMTTVEREGLLRRAGYGGANLRLNLAGTRIARTAWDAMSPAVRDKLTSAYENQFKPADQNQIKNENPSAAKVQEEQKAPEQDPIKNIDAAANEAATSAKNDTPQPTEAQQEAGNYKKGHITVQGLNITIENPEGSKRSGTDEDGKAWEATMAAHYGYIKRTEGNDGDHVDVYVGNDPDSDIAFIVDQSKADGSFDEHKVLLGFPNALSATRAYAKSYEPGWMASRVIAAEKLTISKLKDWLKNGDMSKPYSSKKADQPSAETVTAPEKSEASPVSQKKTDAAPEAKQDKAPASKPKARNKIDPDKDSLFVAIAKAGGMDTDELLSNGIDSNDITVLTSARVSKKTGALGKKRRMPISFGFAMPLHKNGGASIDGMRENLQQYGYFQEGSTERDFLDLFNQELRGDPVYTDRAIELRREQDQEAFDKMMQEEQDRIDAELAAQEIAEADAGYFELGDEERLLADDAAEFAFGENGKQSDNAIRAGMRALGFTEDEINDELAKNSQYEREGQEVAYGSGKEGISGRDGSRPKDAQARERGVEEGFNLANQTNEQAAEQFAQQQAGESAEPTKEQADRERDAVPFSMQMQSQPKPQGVQTGLFTADGRVSAEASPARGEIGASLTKEERATVLKSLIDVYRQKKAPREMKGVDGNGNERYGYVHSPELFEKSDITGAMVRYYVTLPDGRIAHPTELFADYTQADIDAAMQKEIDADRERERNDNSERERLLGLTAPTINEANRKFNHAQRFAQDRDRIVPALLTNGELYLRSRPENADKAASLLGDGWRVEELPKPADAGDRLDAAKIRAGYSHRSLGGLGDKVKMEQGWFDNAAREFAEKVGKDAESDEQKALADKLLADFKDEYKVRRYRVMEVGAGVVSSAVAGRNNFNSAQAGRRGSALDRAEQEFADWRKGAIESGVRAIRAARSPEQIAAEQQAKADKAAKKKASLHATLGKLMDFKKGDDVRFGNYPVAKVSLDKAGYPSSVTVEATDLTDNKFDIARILFNGDKNALRSAVDEIRAAQQVGHTEKQASTESGQESLVDQHNASIAKLHDGELSVDELKAAFAMVRDNRAAIEAELSKFKKDELLRSGGAMFGYRYKSETKPEIVKAAYAAMLDNFIMGESISYALGGGTDWVTTKAKAIQARVDAATPESLAAYAEKIKANRAEREQRREETVKAMADPQTLEDYRRLLQAKVDSGKTSDQARMELTPEQRIAMDTLWAEDNRSRRAQRSESAKTEVRVAAKTTSGDIIETKHTKTGQDLFVVKAAERVERDIYNTWNAAAKKLGGWYSSFRGNGAVPGFQFKTRDGANAFLQYLGGDATAAQEAVQEKRDAFVDDRSQSAVERLNEMADRLEEKADESLGRERKANTERRARFAASAEAAANSDKALAKTMRNIAKAIESGTAKFLDRVRQKSQVEMLRSAIRDAQYKELTVKYPSYADQERHKGEAPTLETVDYAKWPSFTAYRSDLAVLGREMSQIDGTKKIGQALLKVADDVTEAYQKFAKENLHKVSVFSARREGSDEKHPAVFSTAEKAESVIAKSGYKGKATTISFKRGEHMVIMGPSMAREQGIWAGDPDKRITLKPEFAEEIVAKNKELGKRNRLTMPYVFDNVSQDLARWRSMGIESAAEMRAALREYIGLREAPAEASKIKQMERAMIGRKNDGLDFFPTPVETAQAMIDAADIKEGMSVLEPSAGMGHIAEQIRDVSGIDPDVVEFSSDRRELLEAKGFNVVGNDFMDISPRGFTYGDVFKDKDGVEGIMRGSGGLGSNRVGFVPLGKDERQSEWRDRDELVGVRKNGGNSGYDRILMNPPFSNRRDAEHVQHAYSLLKPGGRLVAIMGEGVFFGQDKKAKEFREWLEEVGGTSEKLDEGTFLDPSLPVNTAVNARMVVIDKPAGEAAPADNEGAGNIATPSNLSPDDKAIYGMAAKGKSAADILKFIASASRNPFNRQVAKLLLKTGIAPKVAAGTSEGWKFNAGNDKKYAAAYNPKTDAIALFRPAASERNFLHEAIHAATIQALGKKGMAAGQMKALFAHVEKSGKLKGMYGMSDVDEFVAEAFTNPKFQDALKTVAAPKASGSTLSSAWQWFVRIVRGILGMPQGQENALSQAIEIGLGVMREDMAVRRADNLPETASIAERNDYVNRAIGEWSNGKLKSGVILDLGKPSGILKRFGVPSLPITMTQRVLIKAVREKHAVEFDDLKDLVINIQAPIAVFKSKKDGKIVVVTEARHTDGNIVVALDLDVTRDSVAINDIRSIYPKRDSNVANWIADGLLIGSDKHKGRDWLENSAGSNSQQPQVNAALDGAIIYDGRLIRKAAEAAVIRYAEELKYSYGNGKVIRMADKDTVAGTQAPTSAGDGSTGSAMPPDGYIRLYSGSSEKITEIRNDGIFGGIFASADFDAAESHGLGKDRVTHFMDVPESAIAESRDLDTDQTEEILRKNLGEFSEDEYDDVYKAVVRDKGVFDLGLDDDRIMEIFRSTDMGEAGWEAQRIRGVLAKALGYQAVEMEDEHGLSYLVLPGVKVYPNEPSASAGSDAIRYAAGPKQTDSTAFRKWFGDSKVVDENGEPLVVYHGSQTPEELTSFSPGGRDGSVLSGDAYGVASYFTSSPSEASFYARERGAVLPVYIRGDILDVDGELTKEQSERLTKLANDVMLPSDKARFAIGRKTREFSEVQDARDFFDNQRANWKQFGDGMERAKPEARADNGKYQVEYTDFDAPVEIKSGDDAFTLFRAVGFDNLPAAGFDGLMMRREGGQTWVVMHRPDGNVKSAIGNNGDFDGSNPDIRYNVADDYWEVAEPSKMDEVIYALQDKHIDTKRVVQAIMGAGRKIRDAFNPYLQEELFHGRAAKGVKDFLDFELRPLLKEMQDAKVDMGDFEEYLWNRHAEERNKQIAKINPDMPDGGSGIDTADARAYLANLPAERKRVFESLAAKVDTMNRNSQAILVSSGLEKQETIDAWNGAYQHYVPLQREDVDSGHVGTGKGFSVRGSSSKRAMGSGKKVVDIIANITMQRERNIVRAEKNRVSNALMGLAVQNPNPDFWTVDQAPKERVVEETAIYTVLDADGNKVEEFTRMADAERLANRTPGSTIDQRWGDRVTERVTPGFKNRDNVLLTRINGEDHYIIFNERDERAMRMAMAMKNLDVDNLGRVLSLVGKGTRYLASVNTQYNPVFGVINLIRDAQGALLNLSSTPLAGEQKRVLGYTKDALVGIYKDIRAHRAGKVPSSNWAALFEEFQKEGGQTGYRDQYANAEARAEAIKSELEQFKEGKAKQLARGLFGWLSDYNETMENAVRLAAYKAAKEKGMSKQQAASLAKNITVNFNRKGQMATQIGALYAFFNASVQGTARIAETLFDMKDGDIRTAKLSAVGKKIVYGGIMLGSMQALLLAAAGFDDDEPPEFVRERNLILPIGDGKYLTLAMPLGFHVIPGIGRIATEFVLSGGKDPAKRAISLLGMFAESFNPVGSSGLSIQTLTPSVVDPFAALAENRDFTGREIYRENFNANDPSPGHARAKDIATVWSRYISEAINFITGGTEFKPGAFSPSPDAIDYLIAQAGGGVMREANKVGQTAGAAYTGDDLPLYKIPLVGRFVGDTEGQSGHSQKFYNAVREINMHEREVKGLRESGRADDARAYIAENPVYRMSMLANSTERQVRKLRDVRRKASEDGDADKVRAVNEQITGLMTRFNERAAPLLEQ